MRITICAVGRLRGAPEATLVTDYLDRFGRAGRALGLGPARLVEIEERKMAGAAAEAQHMRRLLPDAARICALDEHGTPLNSPSFATLLGSWRDQGLREAAFLIGGADGLDPALRGAADMVLSLGPMVWPHRLARVMLAEQIYRAATILAGSPYHRA
ncbi:MAG: 23S rRNA (pseudouridine(1915)-N(3))-methyltransferase RlmH [Pseudomonadota bacterium]